MVFVLSYAVRTRKKATDNFERLSTKMVLSKLSNVSPEIIVEISDYLDGCDLYHAFYGLNSRINQILDRHCHRLHLSLINISKTKFDFYCLPLLSTIGHQIVSLRLSGKNSSTPGQLELFLSHFECLANVFPKLESLKLFQYTKSDVQSLLPHLPHLIHLKCLTIGSYKRLMPHAINVNDLFNETVILPTSLRCLAFPYEVSHQMSNVRTSLIEQLHVHIIHINSLFFFLQNFPHLKRLTTILTDMHDNSLVGMRNILPVRPLYSLQYLNVNITHRVFFDDFVRFLNDVPKLKSLSIEGLNPNPEFLDAHRWETVLPPNLSSFRFDFTTSIADESTIIHLFESFQDSFWLTRGWFVQCYSRDHGRYYRFSTIQSPIITTLYWPDDEIRLNLKSSLVIYPDVDHIDLWWNLSRSTESQCPNLRSIELYGAGIDENDILHPNVCEILQCPLLEHIIINDHLPISQTKFASILNKFSNNVHKLTCSIEWLISILESKQFEWISLLLTTRIQSLIVTGDQSISSYNHLLAFCRTFINLHEITMKLESVEHLFLLFNILKELTMANIQLPSASFNDVIEFKKLIEENTTLVDFTVHISSNTSHIIFWIGSRRSRNTIITENA